MIVGVGSGAMPDFDPALERLVAGAFARFEANVRTALPRPAPQILELLHGVPARLDPSIALGLRNFPHYVLPYWLSPPEARAADMEFQADILYSTVNGSYSIRLCDNIADNDSPEKLRKIAPCIACFDSEFTRPYMKYFPAEHAFWSYFDRYWAKQAEASAADALLADVDSEAYAQASSKKFTATKIPVAAVHLRYGATEVSLEPWLNFVDVLGDFAQFNNDFFDWKHDSLYGINTYISSEAKRRAPGESLAKWFLREGFEWGAAALRFRFGRVKKEALPLGNKFVLDWVIARGQAMEHDIIELRSGLELVKTFGKIAASKPA
jgi:hypothetical protein